MSIRLLFLLLFVCLKGICVGQLPSEDSLRVPEYHASACIKKLFVAIVESNKQNYNPQDYFYSVTFKESNNVLYMTVSSVRWTQTSHLDYVGIIRLNKASFLLRGDLDKGGVFERDSNSVLSVLLKKEDSDTSELFFNEPSLRGGYRLCKPMPIDLEVYTKNKISGFDMKVFPPKTQ